MLLTHRHQDHADGAHRFRQLTGAPVRAWDASYCHSADALVDGEIIAVEGVTPQIEVVHTPGHTNDSVCYFIWSGVPGESTLEGIATGDTIAGRHTTMISESDGNLGLYLKTLALLGERGVDVHLLPGHGPDGHDVASFANWYAERRYKRLEQIREAQQKLGPDASLKELIDEVYDNVDPVLRGSAEQSTRVALRYLNEK